MTKPWEKAIKDWHKGHKREYRQSKKKCIICGEVFEVGELR